jgi:hypothetical protein
MNNDASIPGPQLLFEPVQGRYGVRLALVFGNEAPGGVCPFYGRQCYHCDIGAGEGVRFDAQMNRARLTFFCQHYAVALPRVAHLVLYNSGSVLNRRELSDQTLEAILEWAATLPECRVVSLDSREMFITEERLDFALKRVRADQQLRPILGLETQDDQARTVVLNKRIVRTSVETVFRTVAAYGGRVGLDINVMFAPPPFQGQGAVDEVEATALFALGLAARHGAPVDFNLHPYYPSLIGRKHFPAHPRAGFDEVLHAARRLELAVAESRGASNVFIGWQDEAHDQEAALRSVELSRYLEQFARFNTTGAATGLP